MRAALKLVPASELAAGSSLTAPLISPVTEHRPKVLSGKVAAVDLSKSYIVNHRPRRVLDRINFTLHSSQKLGVLGRNGAGKSSLVRLLAGIEQPTSGKVVRTMPMSWPIALNGGFSGSMTGNDCVRFLCRLYNGNEKEIRSIVDDFAELGRFMRMPIKTYSSGMRARLAFGLSLAVEFECYLIDEVMSVGDRRFQAKCFNELFVKRADRAMIIVTHDFEILKHFCTSALVLKGGQGRVFDDVRQAFDIYASL
jgi:capsular polysaccharide transport system ATP-binding protein